jgi:hypothetical protein
MIQLGFVSGSVSIMARATRQTMSSHSRSCGFGQVNRGVPCGAVSLECRFGYRHCPVAEDVDIVLHDLFTSQTNSESHHRELIEDFLLQLLEIHPASVRYFPNSQVLSYRRRPNPWPLLELMRDCAIASMNPTSTTASSGARGLPWSSYGDCRQHFRI